MVLYRIIFFFSLLCDFSLKRPLEPGFSCPATVQRASPPRWGLEISVGLRSSPRSPWAPPARSLCRRDPCGARGSSPASKRPHSAQRSPTRHGHLPALSPPPRRGATTRWERAVGATPQGRGQPLAGKARSPRPAGCGWQPTLPPLLPLKQGRLCGRGWLHAGPRCCLLLRERCAEAAIPLGGRLGPGTTPHASSGPTDTGRELHASKPPLLHAPGGGIRPLPDTPKGLRRGRGSQTSLRGRKAPFLFGSKYRQSGAAPGSPASSLSPGSSGGGGCGRGLRPPRPRGVGGRPQGAARSFLVCPERAGGGGEGVRGGAASVAQSWSR